MAFIRTRDKDKKDRKTGKVTKTRVYIVEWQPPGAEKPMTKSFTKLGSITEPDTAKYFESKIEARIRDAEYVNPDLGKVNLKSYAERWRDRANTDGTQRARQQFINNLGGLENLSVAQVQRPDIRAWTDELLKGRPWARNNPLARSTVSLYVQHLTTLLGIAVEDELRKDNPAKGFRIEGDSYAEDVTGPAPTELITREIIREIMEQCSETVATMIMLTALTGLRVSEVAGLRVMDVSFAEHCLYVTRQADKSPFNDSIKPKSRTSRRRIPLSSLAENLLAAYLDSPHFKRGPGGTIFAAARGGRWYATHLGNEFRRACIKAGYGYDWSWHDLRHYFASRLIFRGYDVRTVSELLGHSSVAFTLKVYVHLWPGSTDRLRLDMNEEVKALSDGGDLSFLVGMKALLPPSQEDVTEALLPWSDS